MNTRTKIIILSLGVLVLSGLLVIGCSMFDDNDASPTAPGAAQLLSNQWCTPGAGNELQIFVGKDGQDAFSVNIPSPAPAATQGYELVYEVLKAGASTASSFLIDFEVTDAAILCLGLEPEDVLETATLYTTDFSGKTPLLIDGALRLFGFPGGWNGWDGSVPPSSVAPVAVSSSGTLLYANGEARVPVMENHCEVVPTSTCAGELIGGYCWYLGELGASCTETCETHGGVSDGTIVYVGVPSGTAEHCQEVLSLIGPADNLPDDAGPDVGCTYIETKKSNYRRTTSETTYDMSDPSARRACSCVN